MEHTTSSRAAHEGWGGKGPTCDPLEDRQVLAVALGAAPLGSNTQHCWGQSLSKFSILLTGLGIPHWLGKQECWMCHCRGCLMCWAGSRWCRAEGNGAVLSGWHPPEHSGLSAREVTARAWCWRGDGKEETGGITELVPGAHNSHNNNVTHPLTAPRCQWNEGSVWEAAMAFVGSTGMEGERRGDLSRDHSGQRKSKCGCFPVLTSQRTTW